MYEGAILLRDFKTSNENIEWVLKETGSQQWCSSCLCASYAQLYTDICMSPERFAQVAQLNNLND